jgi:2-succinyl-6-hydroxy-2,4-cyclohexadiene-1-carboxylate synthase
MNEKRVPVNGVEIQIREYDGDGDAIVFLHFSGANLMMWQPVLPYFQGRFHVVLADLRGHGKSSAPEDGYHMDEMAKDIVGVMQYLGIEKAHVVGSSLGAEVGLGMAANHPDRVISLVCEGALYSEYGPFGIWQGSEQEFNAHVAGRLEKIRSRPEPIYDSIESLMEDNRKMYREMGLWNEYIEAMIRYGTREVEGGKIGKSWGKRTSENYASHYFYSLFEDYYRRIQCPILMLPDEDLMNSGPEKTAMYGLQQLAANCQITEVNAWSHPYGWLLTPEMGSRAVLNFIS